jgi:hypothetical protein
MSKTLYEKYIPQAQQIGHISAKDLFISMLNPNYRGKNFTWERYKEMAVRVAEKQVFTSFTDAVWAKHEDKLLEAARNSAKLSVDQCLKESDVENWMPLGASKEESK